MTDHNEPSPDFQEDDMPPLDMLDGSDLMDAEETEPTEPEPTAEAEPSAEEAEEAEEAEAAEAPEPTSEAQTPAQATPPPMGGAVGVAAEDLGGEAADAAPVDAVEVLRVWRDLADGSLIIDFGGRRYRSLAELKAPDLRRRFIAVLRSLNDMLRAAALNQAPAPAPPSQHPQRPQRPQQTQQTQQEQEAEEDAEQPGMLRQIGRVMMGKRPSPGPLPSEHSMPSIAEQIEVILQERLAALPQFANRSIHIRDSIDGTGLTIYVDDKAYVGVNDVADQEARAVIQAAIREWEAQQ